jgi:hypothetical protein
MRSLAVTAKRRLKWYWKHRGVSKSSMVRFRCNICGDENWLLAREMSRETGTCLHCASTVRWRSIIYALSMEIFGRSLALKDFPVRKDILGVGLSDWEGYGDQLTKYFTYKNTFYHREPLLDISNPDPSEWGKYNFLISSDVFEHVPPPIAAAFEGAHKLLKPGGVMIFSVPYVDGVTREHFPELHRFSIAERNDRHILLNETKDGRKQEFSEVTFHGGPGSTVEMRLFGRESLEADFRNAGFAPPHLYSEQVPECGILWINYDPEKAPYRPLIYGLDTPPWGAKARSDNS